MKKLNSFVSRFSAPLAVLSMALLTPVAAVGDNCSQVKYRLWQEDKVTWYEHGETVEILEGQEGHLYLHVRGKGPTPYSASADMGYPSSFNLGGDAHRVRRHVKMEAQDASDRRAGRIRFRAQEPGTVYLGYNLVSVKVPGSIKDVNPRCRLDKVAVRVLERGGHGRPPVDNRVSAGQELVEVLYRSLLRRERHGQDPSSFVDQVESQGARGVEEVAELMMVSEEFRYQALRRTEEQRADRSRDLAELREWLLRDMYRDLYGLLEPTSREIDEDLAALDVCLSSDRRAESACADLSRNLVTHRLFFERNRDLLDEVEDRRTRYRQGDRYRRP